MSMRDFLRLLLNPRDDTWGLGLGSRGFLFPISPSFGGSKMGALREFKGAMQHQDL